MERAKIRNSNSALYLLFAEGCCFLLISVAVLACGFVLNFNDDFDNELVDEQRDYTQYWVGIVLLITAFLAIGAATRQRNRSLVLSAIFFFLVTILVSLFALVVEGNDWIQHKNAMRRKKFWEDEDYACTSASSTSCICSKAADTKEISAEVDCKTLEKLDFIYGSLICCILAGVFLALSSIVVAVTFISIRPFTVPEPKQRIKRITVLEDEEPKPIVVYKNERKVVEPKPQVEEIVMRERKPQHIVVREPPPRVRTIVYDQPPVQRKVVYAPKQTLVYDEPRPDPTLDQTLVPIKRAPLETELYDVGRFVPKVHPKSSVVEEGFVTNPNFTKPAIQNQPEEPTPVHYGREEIESVPEQPEPVRFVPLQREEPVRYIRKPTIVYEQRPRVPEERALVPVRRSVYSRPKSGIIVRPSQPRPSYVIKRHGQRPLIAVQRRPRAYSDEGQRVHYSRVVRPHPRHRMYTTQPVRAVPKRVDGSRMLSPRIRSNSDEGLRLYRGPLQRERPARLYTDKEITMAGNNAQAPVVSVAKPTVFTEESINTANSRKPASAHPRSEYYDRDLEAGLQAADKWSRRPPTPY